MKRKLSFVDRHTGINLAWPVRTRDWTAWVFGHRRIIGGQPGVSSIRPPDLTKM
jgi:hypothetical protein